MPYIKKEDRMKFINNTHSSAIDNVVEVCDNTGDLNYAITMILKGYLANKGECYATHNEIIGMLECCKQEWYRKHTAIYEEKKEQENGSL